jgi:two-component system cell cycle sensor histidine kinase PleC
VTNAEPARLAEPGPEVLALLPLLDTLRVAVTTFDAHSRLTYANAHLNHLFAGLPPRETLLGRRYGEMLRLMVEGGEIAPVMLAGGVEAFVARALAQIKPGSHAACDIALAGGRVVEVKARHAGDGAAILLWSDVTQARAQFARLEEAVALSADAFAIYDRADRLVMANALYARLVGVELDALLGHTFADVVTMVTRSGRILFDEDPKAWLQRRLESHATPAGHLTVRADTGEAYLVRDRRTPDGGRAIIFTDITDKVRAEAALAEQDSALERSRVEVRRQSDYLADLARRLDQATARADSAKTTLLRTMSHELKTPLNAILGFSELIGTLADRLSAGQIREYAGLIHQGGASLLKIINQIMDLTKISAGRYELHRRPVDTGAALWLAQAAFAKQAARRGVTIDAGRAPAGLMADADEAVLSAMLHGLIDNAVNHTAPGCVVSLSARRRGDEVAIAVHDNGRGVAAEDLARIQEPFEHGERGEGTHHTQGAGLGLTLIKAFAELHGGRLELASGEGRGFTARVILPAAS